MNVKKILGILAGTLVISVWFFAVFVVDGGISSGPKLRGITILELHLPVRASKRESITVTSNRGAARSFLPVAIGTDINLVDIPEPLWTELENLRRSWCTQPPDFVSVQLDDADYQIVLDCNGRRDPIYSVHPADLPPPLRALIDLVPSTSDRLIPNNAEDLFRICALHSGTITTGRHDRP
jgi:hypothetical protein